MSEYRDLAISTAQRHGLPPELFLALVQQESAWNPRAVSSAGAQGLTQLMPGTAGDLGVADPFDPAANLDGGARYLAQQLKTFGTPELALAAYNAGPGNVRKHNGIPPFKETQNYVQRILGSSPVSFGGGGEPAPGPGLPAPAMLPPRQGTDPAALAAAFAPPAQQRRPEAPSAGRGKGRKARTAAMFDGLPGLYG